MSRKLNGVPETMLIPLWARAEESGRARPIIHDPKAVEMVSGIDYDFSRFEKSWLTQVGVSIRTMLLDNAVKAFLWRNPGAVVVNLGAGLDTRQERLKEEPYSFWYDLDVPEALEWRGTFFSQGKTNAFIAKSAFDLSWLDEVDIENKPVLLIAEGLLMYFPEDCLKVFFQKLASRLRGAEMLFEMLAPFLVGRSKVHESLKKMEQAPEFKWGMKNSRDMESWHGDIHFLEEWDYYDFHKKRWKWFGYIGRFPFLRPRLSNRIVHLRFG